METIVRLQCGRRFPNVELSETRFRISCGRRVPILSDACSRHAEYRVNRFVELFYFGNRLPWKTGSLFSNKCPLGNRFSKNTVRRISKHSLNGNQCLRCTGRLLQTLFWLGNRLSKTFVRRYPPDGCETSGWAYTFHHGLETNIQTKFYRRALIIALYTCSISCSCTEWCAL